jgi:hypothetical protein
MIIAFLCRPGNKPNGSFAGMVNNAVTITHEPDRYPDPGRCRRLRWGLAGWQGAEILSAEVRAEIVRPAIVRQASGLEPQRDAPSAQVSRRGRTVLVEFQ